MEGKLRISYVANQLDITPHYLRMLEWEGRIPKVNYDRVGRFYTESDVKLLRAMGVGTHPQKLRRVEDVLEGPQLVTHHASCSALQASRQTWPATPTRLRVGVRVRMLQPPQWKTGRSRNRSRTTGKDKR
jgi:hypothetical protein